MLFRSEMTLMLGNIEGGRRRGQQRMRWLDGITDSMDMSLCKLQGSVFEWDTFFLPSDGMCFIMMLYDKVLVKELVFCVPFELI